MKNRSLLSLGALLGSVLLPNGLAAEPLRLHLRGGAAIPVGGHQADEFGLGTGAVLGLELPITPQFGVGGEVGAIWLSDGAPPANPLILDEGAAAQVAGAFALHFRPWNTTDLGTFGSEAGFWSSASAGLALTGGLQRLLLDVAVGYDVFVDRGGTLGVGPMLGWVHVFQPDTELRPDNANIVMLGIHATFDAVVRAHRDADGDGVVDVNDECPNTPEDKDGFDDEDGCPDEDNDQDGVMDDVDACPLKAEDRDGFEDDDGCPDLDNDKDGIGDGSDRCPLNPEDQDGFEDADGCPDEDNDKDGIADPQDACPNEAETMNGYADEDGCPDAEQVRVVGDMIVLDDKVHFATNSAVIRSVSYGLLSRVAALILEHPDYIHIEVHGHADRRGDANFNRDLSERRAQSVMNFLIEQGRLEASRLSFKGFGSEQPLMDKDTEWAWFMNRRVEFKITRDPNSAAAKHGVVREPLPTKEAPTQTSEHGATPPSETKADSKVSAPGAEGGEAPEGDAGVSEPVGSDLGTEVAPW